MTCASVFVAGARSTWQDYLGWQSAANDRSAEEAYRTFFTVDAIWTTLAAVATAFLLRLIRKSRRSHQV